MYHLKLYKNRNYYLRITTFAMNSKKAPEMNIQAKTDFNETKKFVNRKNTNNVIYIFSIQAK